MIKNTVIACVMTTAVVSGFSRTSPRTRQPPPDLVVLNAKVVTLDRASTIAQAVAIRGGRFVAVGSDQQVRAIAGTTTRVIDAGGRTIIPGIIDTHVHATGVASAEAAQPFRSLESIGAVQQWIRKEAQRVPAGTWIWSPRMYPTRLREGRFPTRAELDAAALQHPVVIDGAYALVVNTAALKAAGITRATPNPRGGAIVKDIDGEPTGLLRNVGGMLAKFRRADAADLPLDQLERVHQAYNRIGITSIIERGSSVAGYRAYEALKKNNRLRVRSTITIRIPAEGDPREFIGKLPVKFGAGDDWLKVGPLKIVADGGILIGTSYMRRPYGLQAGELYGLDDPHYRGLLTLHEGQIRSAVTAGHEAGWQMVAHVTGDAGVDAVLDGIEAAQKANPEVNRRHTLIHAYFANAETARRAARLNVLVDTQPAWYYKDGDALVKALGKPRLEHFVGLRTWLDAGVRTAINTDHMFGVDPDSAMNPFNPFLTMYVATTRRTESGQTISAGEAVTREQALRMMTSDAAYFTFDEGNRGSIGLGKLGDLVVLSEDLLSVPVERIRHVRPELTIVGGRIAYESGRLQSNGSISAPQPARFVIDAHQHWRNEPGYIDTLVSIYRPRNAMACVLTPMAGFDVVRQAAAKFPDVVIPYGYVSVDDPNAIAEIEKFAAAGFKGVKMHRPKKDWDDPGYFPIYQRLQDRGLVALFHTGIVSGSTSDEPETSSMARMRPSFLHTIARSFPKLRIQGAHLGNPWYEEAAEAARWEKNLYFDVTGSTLIKKANNLAVFKEYLWWEGPTAHSSPDAIYAFEKLVFGTDEPPDALDVNLARYEAMLNGCGVPEASRRKIYGETMARILGIKART